MPNLLQNMLRIINYEAAHNSQSNVQVHLEEETGSKEDVEEGEPEEGGECRQQSATQVQEVSSGSKQGRQGEAGKHHTCAQQCL